MQNIELVLGTSLENGENVMLAGKEAQKHKLVHRCDRFWQEQKLLASPFPFSCSISRSAASSWILQAICVMTSYRVLIRPRLLCR